MEKNKINEIKIYNEMENLASNGNKGGYAELISKSKKYIKSGYFKRFSGLAIEPMLWGASYGYFMSKKDLNGNKLYREVLKFYANQVKRNKIKDLNAIKEILFSLDSIKRDKKFRKLYYLIRNKFKNRKFEYLNRSGDSEYKNIKLLLNLDIDETKDSQKGLLLDEKSASSDTEYNKSEMTYIEDEKVSEEAGDSLENRSIEGESLSQSETNSGGELNYGSCNDHYLPLDVFTLNYSNYKMFQHKLFNPKRIIEKYELTDFAKNILNVGIRPAPKQYTKMDQNEIDSPK